MNQFPMHRNICGQEITVHKACNSELCRSYAGVLPEEPGQGQFTPFLVYGVGAPVLVADLEEQYCTGIGLLELPNLDPDE